MPGGNFGNTPISPQTGTATYGLPVNPKTGRPYTKEEYDALPKDGWGGKDWLLAAATGGLYNPLTKQAGTAVVEGVTGRDLGAIGQDVAEGAGLTRPDLSNIQGDTEALRQMRRDFANEYVNLGGRVVPKVEAERAAAVDLGPAETMQAAQADRAREVRAPTLGPVERAEAAMAMAAPVSRVGPTQGVTIDRGGSDSARAIQGEAIQATRDVLSGKAPSVAELQLRDTLNRNVQQQNAIRAGARGLSAASARRQAAQNIARLNLDTGAAGALLRAKEVEGARNSLGSMATDVRGQDIGLATSQAGLDSTRIQSDADRLAKENLTEAQLRTDVSQSNAANQTGVSQFNAGQANQRQVQQGQMQLQAEEGNAGREQQTNIANAGFEQGAREANMGATNQRAVDQGRITADNNQFNATQGNQVGAQNADRELEGRNLDDDRAASLRGDMVSAGRSAAESELGGIRTDEDAKKRRTDVVANVGKSAAAAFGLARGGLVTRPTHALIGEAGPELVIPVKDVSPEDRRRFAIEARPFSRAAAPPLRTVIDRAAETRDRRRQAAREMSY